jgi:uncharacterized membrane protein
MEQAALEHRTVTDRLGDAIVGFIGTMKFVVLHLLWFLAWFAINTGKVPGVKVFDPYPFVLLTMMVSMEGVLLATFILMKQNRMSRRADHRDHLHLQIDLLAEEEITKILQMQRQICDHFRIGQATDPEVVELSQHTAVEDLSKELEQKLPAE